MNEVGTLLDAVGKLEEKFDKRFDSLSTKIDNRFEALNCSQHMVKIGKLEQMLENGNRYRQEKLAGRELSLKSAIVILGLLSFAFSVATFVLGKIL